MAVIKTEAVILRMTDFRESSKILTCYTRDYGKMALIAKGAKRLKSRIGGALDLLHHLAAVIYRRETREVQTLSSAEILHAFPGFQEDLDRFSLALAAAEFLDRVEPKEAPNPRLFRQFLETLRAMETAESAELLFLQFIWRWLEGAGFKPKLRRCLRCGQPPAGKFVYFSVAQGSYLCEKCLRPGEELPKILRKSVEILLYLRDSTTKAVAGQRFSADVLQPVAAITWRYLQYHTDISADLKSLRFLRKLKFSEKNGSRLYAKT